jgi:hypothetical protein
MLCVPQVSTFVCLISFARYDILPCGASSLITDINLPQFSWFMAGRVLGRFWQAALDANSAEQVQTLRVEVEYIMYVRSLLETGLAPYSHASSAALAKLGQRVPLASKSFLDLMFPRILTSLIPDKYNMMLHEVAAKADGMNSIMDAA